MSISFIAGAVDDGNSATRSVTIPATAQAGDLALLILDRGANETPSNPTGWTLFGTASASSLTSTVWRKKLVAGDPGAVVTVTNASAGKSTLSLGVRRGVDPNSLIEFGTSATSTSSSTTRVTPTGTTVTDQDWIVEHVVDKSSAAGTAWTLPGGRTVRQQFYETGSGALTMVTADSNAGVSPGSQGGGTFTETVAGTQAVMWTFAVKPAPTGPSTPTNIAKAVSTASQTSLQLTTTAGAAVGDLLVGAVGFDADHITLPTLTVTDDAGNLWTVAATDNNGASEGLAVFTTTVTTLFATGSHILLSVDSARHLWAATVDKYTGITAPGIDQAATGEGTSATVAVGPTPTLGQSAELAVLAVAWNSHALGESFTPAAGWATISGTATTTGTTDINVATAYQVMANTNPVSGGGTLPTSDTFEAGIVTFRAGASTNRPPTANAGADQIITGGQTVTLDGTASTDLDGTIASFAWTQTAGTTVTLDDPTNPTPSFLAPATTLTQSLTFHLVVTDNNSATASDDVIISVTPSATIAHRESGAWVSKSLLTRVNGAWVQVGASGPPQGTISGNPPYFGTLVTLTAHAQAESTAGSKAAMLELNWASYETSEGVFSSSYITTIQAQYAALRAAGMTVTLAMGVHHPPAWVTALANSTQIDQAGATTTQVDTIFNQVIRNKVQAYYDQIDHDLGIESFWAIRLTSGGNAEMLHPGGNSYWAFGPNAQNGPNMPLTMDPNPFPGWKPGAAAGLTTAQIRQWATWYVNALVDVTDWQMNYFTGLGFTGYFQTLTPGSGRRPSVFTSDVNSFLPNSTTGVGAVWDIYYANLRNRANVIAYVSSVADGSGSDDFSQPGDDALAITSTTMNAWSATRWQTRLAHEYDMLVGGENPGFTTGGAAHYGDTTSSGLMAKSMAQVTGCGLFVFYWAHDDRLWDGTSQAFANYAAYIATLSGVPVGSVVNVFPNPDSVVGGTAFATSLTTAVLGSTDYAANGTGSTKITVGASPTTNTFAYQPVAADTDPVSNGHLRYAAAPGDTFDILFTVKAHASNAGPINILPKVAGYHWSGTANVSSSGGDANGTAVPLNPGDVVAVAQRITVATPPTDPLDGVLIIPHIRDTVVANPPATGTIVYLDRMMAVRNAPRVLTTADWFDGDTPGDAWTGGGGPNKGSSTGTV